MKKIKIKYVDFWPSLNPEDFIFTKLLRKHFEVEISDNPDYIFYSLIGNKDYLNYDCIRIFYTGENWSYVNILDTKSQTFLCCTSS